MEAEAKQRRSRALNRMSAREVETQTKPGLYPDGGGLYLRVSENGNKKWELRYTSPISGKRVDMGLGRANKGHVSLAAAREAAQKARDLLARQRDPRDERERERQEALAASAALANRRSFGAFADDWMDRNEGQFRNLKHRAQWRSTLRNYAASLLEMAPDAITTQHVLGVLKPIWLEKPETAKRIQGRIERLLNAARAEGLRSGDNPAQWRGHLDTLLPKRPKAVHHPALPYELAPDFIQLLRQQGGVAARALEFLILTAARSGEVRGMRWEELDAIRTTWVVPADRMKAHKLHRVPIGTRAREILAEVELLLPSEGARDGLVFPGARPGSALSDMTLSAVLKRMRTAHPDQAQLLQDRDGAEIVVHGFRSTFRDWAEDKARFPARVIEEALAHTIKNQAEAAYRRGDALEVRVELMQVWEHYLSSAKSGENVLPFAKVSR